MNNNRRRGVRSFMMALLTVSAVIFGIGYTVYTYMLPKTFVVPEYGISFTIPSPAALSWEYKEHSEYGHVFMGDSDYSFDGWIAVSDAVCIKQEQPSENCTHAEVFEAVLATQIAEMDDEAYAVYLPNNIGGENGETKFRSRDKICTTKACEYQYDGGFPVYVNYHTEITPVLHDSCEVAYQKLTTKGPQLRHLQLWHGYISAKCGTNHLFMDVIFLGEQVEIIAESIKPLDSD